MGKAAGGLGPKRKQIASLGQHLATESHAAVCEKDGHLGFMGRRTESQTN